MRRKLPIGIQNFREVREAGHYYVDKTPTSNAFWTTASTFSCLAPGGSARACS